MPEFWAMFGLFWAISGVLVQASSQKAKTKQALDEAVGIEVQLRCNDFDTIPIYGIPRSLLPSYMTDSCMPHHNSVGSTIRVLTPRSLPSTNDVCRRTVPPHTTPMHAVLIGMLGLCCDCAVTAAVLISVLSALWCMLGTIPHACLVPSPPMHVGPFRPAAASPRSVGSSGRRARSKR